MIFGKLKNYLIAGLSALVGALVLALSIFGRIASKRKAENKILKADNEHRQEVSEKDNEIEEQTRSRRADAVNEIKQGKAPDVFLDPNRMRGKPNR